MKHLKIYRAIRLIHRSGSIRKAATQLSISPSALNRAVQAFEDELTFSIFERMPNGVRLSEAGELLLDAIERHLVEFGELQAQLGRLRDGETGDLKISIGSDIAAGVTLACIADIEDRFPGLSIEVVSDDTTNSLRQRRVHLALLTSPVTDDATDVVYSSHRPLLALQRPSTARPPKGIWELADRRVILPVEGTGSRSAISHFLRRKRSRFNRVTTTVAAQLDQHMTREGPICIFPDVSVHQSSYQELPLSLGTVQICAIRLNGVPLIRPAQTYLVRLQQRLENS